MTSPLARLPIRWRIVAGTVAPALVVLVVIGVGAQRRERDHFVGLLDDAVREEAGEMAPLLVGERRTSDLTPLLHEDDPRSLLLQAFDGNGKMVATSDGASDLDLLGAWTAPDDGGPSFASVDGVGTVRLLVLPATIQGRPFVLVSGVPYGPTAATLADLQQRRLAWSALGLAVAGALAWAVATAALRPVERMRRKALELSARPDERLPLPPADDEIRRLGETLNATLDDLAEVADRRRALVAHASHELRTPLTRLRAGLELARRSPRSEAELLALVDDVAVDAEELIALTDALLDLSALESGPPPDVAPLDLGGAVRGHAARLGVPCTASGRPVVAVDDAGLGRVVANLVQNARLHGRPPIDIEVRADGDRAVVVVWDHGPGVDAELGSAAFEAFTRGRDAAGRRGRGLGLAIVATVVDQAGGHCRLRHEQDRFGVEVVLPAVVPAEAGAQARP